MTRPCELEGGDQSGDARPDDDDVLWSPVSREPARRVRDRRDNIFAGDEHQSPGDERAFTEKIPAGMEWGLPFHIDTLVLIPPQILSDLDWAGVAPLPDPSDDFLFRTLPRYDVA